LTVHDASGGREPSALARFAPARLGAVSWLVPPGLAGQVAEQARSEAAAAAARAGVPLPARRVRLLPAVLGVYFVLGLCLFSWLSYQEVLRGLAGGPAPAATALTGLRRRLGPRPFELLLERVAGHLSPGTAPWSHVCGLLAVAWDGTTLKLPASPENRAWAGPPHGGRHYPRARLVALAACGTRCLIGAAAGPSRTGERALAAGLTGYLRAGMLLLADRGFYSWGLWHAAAATGAHLLWRVPAGLHLPVLRELPDGSFLARVDNPREKANRSRKNGSRRRAGQPPDTSPLPGHATVRVIEFTVTVTGDDGSSRTQRYRMITTLLDCRAAPAGELAAAYARRWAAETCFAELKARLRGPGRILRSRTPELALQETWAYLIAYQAVRAVIARAAASAGLDPARLSFTTALNAVRATAGRRPARALAHADAALLASPVPCRPGRVRPRQLREFPAYPRTPAKPKPAPRNATYTITTTPPRPALPAHTPHDQPKPPTRQPKPPP
jgi:Transposase DDE domain/Insertion element 4 transposase N-terminal